MERSRKGASMVLVIVVCLLSLMLGALATSVLRLMGSKQEQHTAIESAALAAANDLGKIFIEDPHFGYVGLVDYAPVGKGVAAADGYGLPVHSLNTILATIRLDMIIAQQLKNPDMQQMAAADYRYAMSARANLNAALLSAITPGAPSFTDVNGNSFNAYQDALAAYQKNVIRMAGPSKLTANSLQLTLGVNLQGVTTTPIPNPTSMANVAANGQQNGYYVAYKNVPINDHNFVFSGVTDSPALIDLANYAAGQQPSLPYTVPSSVMAQAAQTFSNGGFQQTDKACAQVGGPRDTRPAPGALVVNFPDGCPTEMNSLSTLIESPAVAQVPMKWYSVSGDFPNSTSSLTPVETLNYPLGASNSAMSAIELGTYCWLKHAGPSVNIQSLLNMMASPILSETPPPRVELFSASLWPNFKLSYLTDPTAPMVGQTTCPLGLMAMYTLNSANGTIQESVLVDDWIYTTDSDAQVVACSSQGLQAGSTSQTYDTLVSIKDYQFGASAGGTHGGEPIVDSRLTENPIYTPAFVATPNIMPGRGSWPCDGSAWDNHAGGWAYARWQQIVGGNPAGGDITVPYLSPQPRGSGGAIRPTYQQNGLSVEIAVHKVVWNNRSSWGSTASYVNAWTGYKYH
jgi:hypothetical protein